MTTKGKVLVLVSRGHGLPLKDGKVYTGAGYYLNELTVPVRALMKEGYEITFANPKGNTPQMDVNSAIAQFFGGDEDEVVIFCPIDGARGNQRAPLRRVRLLFQHLFNLADFFFNFCGALFLFGFRSQIGVIDDLAHLFFDGTLRLMNLASCFVLRALVHLVSPCRF